MKTNLIIICLLFSFSKVLKAQYIPLHLDVGTCWSYQHYIISSTPGFPQHFSARTTIIGDTVISGKKYAVAKKFVKRWFPVMPALAYSVDYYLRNDTANRKVYSYESGMESLLYDFNLGIGDAIPRISGKVDTVGTTLIYGINRKFYGLKSIYPEDNKPLLLFYEGIGETRANFDTKLPYYDSNFNGGWAWIYSIFLNCAYQSVPLYGDSSSALFCYPTAIEANTISDNNFRIYPNPTNGVINFICDKVSRFNVKVFDVFGKVHFEKARMTNKEYVDITQLQSGLYFIQITDGINYKTEKIWKQ